MAETIFHREKSKRRFTIIPNEVLQRGDISWKAKGILAYILSLPDDWKIRIQELQNHATEGEKALRTGIAELEEFGYIKKKTVRNDDGTFKQINYHVYETVQPADTEEEHGLNSESDPDACFRHADNPHADNGALQSTNIQSTDITKEKHSCASSEIQELDTKVEELFQFYREKSGKKYKNLYPLKQKARLRLKTYTLEEMKTAISNILATPYMTGDNENHTYYATWEYCVRNDQNIDKWLNANEEVSDADSRRIIENIERLARKKSGQ
jgi:hypothetical protein